MNDPVTLAQIINGDEYRVEPGVTRYEVAPGHVVTLRLPTAALVEEFESIAERAKTATGAQARMLDREACVKITEGTWPEEGALIDAVVGVVVEDFFYASSGTTKRRAMRLAESRLSRFARKLARPPGHENGAAVEADGPTS